MRNREIGGLRLTWHDTKGGVAMQLKGLVPTKMNAARRDDGDRGFIPTCVPSGIIRETMKEGKKTCFGNESHTSRCSFSSGRSQTSHENGSTLLGSRTLGDHLPRLDCPSQSRRDRKRYGGVSHDGAPRHFHL